MRGLSIVLVSGLCALALEAGDSTKKLPVPDRAAQDKIVALVHDIFKDDLQAAREPESHTKLAHTLLQQGKECRDDVAIRYVLYGEALVLAAKGGDANLALAVVEELTREFDVNPLELKARALAAVAENVASAEAGKLVVDLVMPLIADAVDADNYDVAFAFGKVADKAARKSKAAALVSAVQKRNEEVEAVYKGFARLQVHIDRLKQDPKDAAANLELGKYFALYKGRWERALPLLAMGSDPALKNAALHDLAGPRESKDQLAVADAWWELAATAKDPAQLHLQRRAMHWYEQSLANLAGLNRTKALKRIDKINARLAGSTSAEAPAGPVGELKKFEGHSNDIKSVALSPDGRHAVSGGRDQSVRVWDVATGKEEKLLSGHSNEVWGVAFHPNNRQVFSVSWDATARLWDVKQGTELRRFRHGKDVNGLAVSRDGNTILTGCDDQHVYLWNATTGEELRKFRGHQAFVFGVAFAPDGRHVASGSVDKTVRVYDLGTGNQVKVFEGSSNSVTNVAFTPDSRYVLSSGDNVVHVWDLASGKEVRKFEGHAGLVPALALSPDGRRLLTGGDDKTVRLWDVATGKELYKFQGHTDTVTCVAFSADGRRAISGSLDRTVRLWSLPVRSLVQ